MQQKKASLKIHLRSDPIRIFYSILAVLFPFLTCSFSHASQERRLPAGFYMPFYTSRASKTLTKTVSLRKPKKINSFWLDSHAVTNGDYLDFVKTHPEWQRSHIGRVFADESYLKHWASNLKLKNPSDYDRPVTQVSWFAASAFCHAKEKELPTSDQWEYAAEDAGRNSVSIRDQILKWYSAPNAKTLQSVKNGRANGYGIQGLHGLIWEWTLDFNNNMIGSELRSDGTKDDSLFCGAGSLNALDPSDYAKFMRYSFRNSLRADYTTTNLGFRCAREEIK